MTFLWMFFIGASVWPLMLAALSLRKGTRTLSSWLFAGGMFLLAGDAMLEAAGFRLQNIILLERLRIVLISFLPVVWLAFSICYSRGNHREFFAKWKWLLMVAGLVPVFALITMVRSLETSLLSNDQLGRPVLQLFWVGRAVHLALVVASVLILMNLERTFTASVGTLRWRIKFMVLGIGLIIAVRFYTSTHAFLYSSPDSEMATLHTVAVCIGCGLMTVSFLRSSVSGVEVYPSLSVLHHSLTVLLAGAYLVIVGVLSDLPLGGSATPLKSLLILLSCVTLGLLLVSERVRFVFRRFVSRHFRRSFYDYRNLWRTFTERTSSVVDAPSYCREMASVVSEALQVLSVRAWLVDDSRGKLVFVASTALPHSKPGGSPDSEVEAAPFLEAFARRTEPLALEDCHEDWVEVLNRFNPDQFRRGNKVAVPLTGKGQLLGLLIVGDRVNGVPLSIEDLELLKCIGDQAASGLLNLQLAHRLLRAREMEAFQSMAAFFVHDLKNTASSLSLMLQNLPAQMENPAFRQDAFRAVSKAVNKLTDLIGRLSLLRQKMEIHPAATELGVIVRAAIEAAAMPPGVRLKTDYSASLKVIADAEQIQKVATNLLINAREAVSENGEISVRTFGEDGWAVISVADNGCGISPEFLSRSLFRPFQTTKKSGIGIGMFHCKTIVEAHQGRIEVESQVGKGTVFRVLLPVGGDV